MNESPIVLACEDVTLGYEHKPLLEHLTLTVRAGDYLCIVGENGSGKSTLLRCLNLLEQPTSFSKKWLSRFFEVLQDLCEERLQSFALRVVEEIGGGSSRT